MIIHKRIVTVYQDKHGRYCLVEETGITPDGSVRVVDARWHHNLTEKSVTRMAWVVDRHALGCRPFMAGLVGYVAEMPACIVT